MTPPQRTVALPARVALVVVPLFAATAVLVFALELAAGRMGGDPSGADAVNAAPLLSEPSPPQLQRVPGGGTWAATHTDGSGEPVGWPACATVHWVHNPTDMPVGALRDVEEALRRIGERTGLRFQHLGGTDEAPSAQRPTYQPSRYGSGPAPVLIAFVGDDTGLPLGATDRAVTIAVVERNGDDAAIVTGQVLLRPDAGEPGDFTSRARGLGAVLLHELGHLVGLTHVGDPDELMFAHPTPGEVAWGAGDLAGLEAVGSADC